MRRLFYLASLAAAGALLTSCDWGIQIYQPTNPSIFKVNQDTDRLEVGPESQEQQVSIASDMFWYASLKDGDWCTLGDYSYFNEFTSILTFRVQANTSTESRTDSLIVLSGNEVRKIAIVQNGIGSLINTSEINLHGTIPIQYKLNAKGSWTITQDGDWFSVSPDSYSGGTIVTFTALSDNLDTRGRQGSVTFKLSGLNFTLPVKQDITETIIVQNSTVDLESPGGNFSVKTYTNVDYHVSTDVDWIHKLGTRALLEFDEPFSADANTGTAQRIGHITFTYGEISETVTVTQAAQDPILSVTTPGFYGLNGKNYVYTKGICQTGRLTKGGSRVFRIIFPADVCVVQLDGVPLTLTSGATFEPTVSVHSKGIMTYCQSMSVKVMGEDEKFIWLKNSDNTYFILKKQ